MSAAFPVDPAVHARIRPMEARDVPAVAAQHHAAMGRSLWARLGVPFLEAIYAGLLRDPRFLGYVYDHEGGLGGFIAGSTDTDAMRRAVLRARAVPLARAAARGLVRAPDVLPLLLETGRYGDRSGARDVPAESLFCSFVPALRGTRVSGHINKVLFEALRDRGHRAVKVTTEQDNADARRQLARWGFEERAAFTFYGKAMVTCVLDLDACVRLDAPPGGVAGGG
ncbi:MAG: hypothetical protein RLZZ299_2187 [Pseudomonadota bacterium]